MKTKTIIRNGKRITVIKYEGDSNWQIVEKNNG